MSQEIVLNGQVVATDSDTQNKDASSSNYILVRTTGQPLNKDQKKELETLGVDIHEFVGNEHQQLYLCGYLNDSLAKVRGLKYIEYADIYSKKFVVPENVEAMHMGSSDMVEVDVLMHRDVDGIKEDLIGKISEAARVDKSAISVDSGIARVKLDGHALPNLAALDEVRVIHVVNERVLFTNIARRLLGSDKMVNGTVYKGQDQIICVADTGFDAGSTTDVHDAFTGRVRGLHAWGRKVQDSSDDPDGHGTHVCGSLVGRGLHSSEGAIEGTAPDASLVVQSMFVRFNDQGRTVLGGYPKDLGELFEQGYQAGARIHTNSWGTPLPSSNAQNPYNSSAECIDRYVWDRQDMVILFASGNDGQDSDLDGKVNDRSLGAEASAKNCITVGASESLRADLRSGKSASPYTYGAFWPFKFPRNPLKDDHQADNPEGLAAFSSRGPTAENRLKPDVVAPGTAILSAKSRKKMYLADIDRTGVSKDSRYLYLSGTSMATPLVAGCCAAIRECLLSNGYADEVGGVKNPSASLVKAILINGAVPMKGQYVPVDIKQEPNPHSGFGRVNIANSIEMVDPRITTSGYGVGAIDEETGQPFVAQIPIPRSSQGHGLTLKVTLVYADLPGASLSNDLNLVVAAGGRQRHGNQDGQEFDIHAMEPFDRGNNVEQVVWPQIPEDVAKVTVKHYRLLSPRVPFAYAWRFF